MPGLGFSGPNLATVAYAEVDGVEGASTATNSGVTTTRTALGTYVVILPTTLTQNESRDLIFVTLKQSSDGSGLVAKNCVVDDSLPATKVVNIFSGNPALAASTKIDSSFTVIILRSTIAPPLGAPA